MKVTLKATLVPDIRRHQFIPGAVELNPTQRTMFWSCPCGCGSIGYVELGRVFVIRDPIGVYQMVLGLDSKPAPGQPAPMGLILEEGGRNVLHWQGSLIQGEWVEDYPTP